MELVCSRPCLKLDLRSAAPYFGIHGCEDHAHLTNQVGVNDCGRTDASRPAHSLRGIHAVSLHLDIGGADAGHHDVRGAVGETARRHSRVGQADAGQGSNEIDRIASHYADAWQIPHCLFRKHGADG